MKLTYDDGKTCSDIVIGWLKGEDQYDCTLDSNWVYYWRYGI